MFDYIFRKLGIESFRTQNIIHHIGSSLIYKIGSVVANFLLVPLTINYLDNENYGIWLTLTSFISWFSFFDIGLGNGLRNKFAEAKALGNDDDAKAYVSTAYYTIGAVSVVLVFLFLMINGFINWTIVFNTSDALREELTVLLPIVFGFFGLQLVVKLITTIYQADQHHSILNKVQFFTQGFSLIIIWLLTKTESSSLLIFGIIYSFIPVLILIILNIYGFRTSFKKFKPEISWWNKEHLKDITGLGFKFFIIQIAAMILFSTDNFIITQLFGPEEVVPYNVAYKYFSIVMIGYSLIIAPFWSSFTEAYSIRDFNWIKSVVFKIQKLWLFVPAALLVMVYLSDWFYKIWVGDSVIVPIYLSLSMALFVALSTFNSIYVNFINGVGKIKLQLVTSVISILINIPLSIFLATYLEWGIIGVILATCFCLGYSVILRPMQYFKIISGRAKGIWAE